MQGGTDFLRHLNAAATQAAQVKWLADICTHKDIGIVPCDRDTGAQLTHNGIADASSDPKVIAAWWDRWPEAGICIPFGCYSGLRAFEVADWRFSGGGEKRWLKRTRARLEAQGRGDLAQKFLSRMKLESSVLYLFGVARDFVMPTDAFKPGYCILGDGHMLVIRPAARITVEEVDR